MSESVDRTAWRTSRGETPGDEPKPSAVAPVEGYRFPLLTARSLTGRPYRLPEEFEGALNVVLVGFEPWHQGLIDSWIPPVEVIAGDRPEIRIYELVPIRRALLPMRPVIDGGMAREIRKERVRARTLTAFADLDRITAALGLPDTRDVGVFLVEPGGTILWRAWGAYDPVLARGLVRSLRVPAPSRRPRRLPVDRV